VGLNTSCVVEYLGIPYAKPAVGELRFAAPQPIDRNQPYVAANFGYDCPLTPSKPVDYPGFTPQAQRIINYFASAAGTPQDEDCLTLNIWSKVTARGAAGKKPVLVFFYGERMSPLFNDYPASLVCT
jgi:carboxylesterase type B